MREVENLSRKYLKDIVILFDSQAVIKPLNLWIKTKLVLDNSTKLDMQGKNNSFTIR